MSSEPQRILKAQFLPAVPNFGSVISTVAGSGDGFAGSITSGHGITGLSEGGAGSTVTGQFVTELTIR